MSVCSLYNNTRDLSANAVMAGQAYQNIVKFISAAHNNSKEAMEDAERALNEVYLLFFFFFFSFFFFFGIPQLNLWGSPLLGEIFAYVTVF